MMELYTFSISKDACSGGHMDIFIHFTMCFVHLRGAHDRIYTFSISNDACSGGQMVEMYSFSMGEDESARADAQNYLNKNGSKKSIFSK